ncbi:enoyl-CoA hydratase/isomerase family protein [Ornithinimicrobium murale]|uniref:enoyl-CoA hydratase/isomerase family protein n=1 Tax=Ornithinimicrobium murale TaxID=1050153 RepID=UPI000E0DA2CA|nr:enoyl-CoA hydratase/isomerase family protein [Ornithinimicrobium murale]
MSIQLELDGPIARITLARPEALNAFTYQAYGELADAVIQANAAPRVSVIVIKGTGRAFSTGGDLKQINDAFLANDRQRIAEVTQLFATNSLRAFTSLESSPKTIVGAINGTCEAGGVGLLLCTDLSVAVRSAVFRVPEGLVGLADPFIPARLPARVGIAAAKRLLLTAERIDADSALEMGLVNEVCEAEDFDRRVEELVADLLEISPATRHLYKRVVNVAQLPFDADIMLRGNMGADAQEGVAAFAARKKPDWPSARSS